VIDDHEFEPLLGRMGSATSKSASRYLGRVLAASRLTGRASPNRPHRGLARIGRGTGAGAILALPSPRRNMRRVIVKTRLVRLSGRAMGAARAHLRYIQRDGVQRDGSPGQLYSAVDGEADGKAFIEHCHGDRHQFRIIVSAEDGREYDDFRPLVRRFMSTMEKDLGTRLEWVAADHVDTAHPHSHIILRGKDDRGANLVICREYITQGMRERAAELVSLDLGPVSALEIEQRMRREVEAERPTRLDRLLIRAAGEDGSLLPGGRTMAEHSLRLARLRKLEAMGLAEKLGGGRWRLQEDFESTLRKISEKGDIIRTMQRAMTRAGIGRAGADLQVHDPALGRPIVGRLVDRGLSDELSDCHYLIVDALDGRTYHVNAGPAAALEPMPRGAIVSIEPVATRAAWPNVELQSALPIDRLAQFEGATWLDRELAAPSLGPIRDGGFGRQVRSALNARRAWLIERGFAEGDADHIVVRPEAIASLTRLDIQNAATLLSGETGLAFAEPIAGERFEGVLKRHIDLGTGRFAMIENGREFLLVPWEPKFEGRIHRQVAGLVRADRIDWSLGRQRGIAR
jgi:type IV secretory pathway VirD2 relaxase